MDKIQKKNIQITVVLYVLMFVYAVFTTMTGTQLLLLLKEFRLDLSEGGIFTVIINAGCILGILFSAFFIDRFDSRHLVLVSYFIFGMLLLLVKFAGSYISFLAVLLGIGCSMKFLDASINASISRLNKKNSGFYMNLLHCSFGIGAFVGPLFTTFLMTNGTAWRDAYYYLGAVCIVTGLIYFMMQRNCSIAAEDNNKADKSNSHKKVLCPRVICLMGILLFYCGHQMGINSWLPAYMQEVLHTTQAAANLSVSSFWVGLIFGRLISAVLSRRMAEEQILKYGLLLGTILLFVGILSRIPILTVAGVTGAGLFAGAAIPLVLTIGYGWFPGALGKVSTLLFLCIAAGAVIFPWIMGISSKKGGLFTAMTVDALCLGTAAVIAAIVLPGLKKR